MKNTELAVKLKDGQRVNIYIQTADGKKVFNFVVVGNKAFLSRFDGTGGRHDVNYIVVSEVALYSDFKN